MEQKKIKIRVEKHSKIDGHITYFLILEMDGKSYTVLKRYSELKTFHDSIRRETNSNSFPKFPPKKFFGKSEEFITKRQQELSAFFEGLCNSNEFINLPSFTKFIENCKKTMRENKVAVEKKEEKKNTDILKKKMSDRTTIDKIREKLKPDRTENKRLNRDEIKALDNEFESVVDSLKKKLISIDFMIELNPNQKTESEYEKIIKEDNNLGNEEIKENIEPGNDDNFNLVSDTHENFDSLEKEINQKMTSIISKTKEIEKLYDINEILKIL